MRVMASVIEQLEREFAAWGSAAGAVAAGFGRSALRLALEALEVCGGDVLVPDFICAQVPQAVRQAGARPVFYPVRRDLSVNIAELEGRFTVGTRAAIAAHYFGRLLPEIGRLAAICRKNLVPLIEDCALALGASAGGRRGGAWGDLAVFSFTKSDWCYGGGMVTSNSPELLGKLRARRREIFRPSSGLLWRYGLLRRADFAANRPAWSRAAEHMGRWIERLSGSKEENFYDTGRFDVRAAGFTARRARQLLDDLPAATVRRQEILRQLFRALKDAREILFRAEVEDGDAGSFLLIGCRDDEAVSWVERAAREGVTLRRCWPAYQRIEGLAAGLDLAWLEEHLLILEVHPKLAANEVDRIASVLERLAGGANTDSATHALRRQ
jgi:dTDP-4-amino-4,6-dideoxygalactose transaminase